MASKHDDAGIDALTKLLRRQVEQLDISASTKSLFLFIVDNSGDYLSFARRYLQQRAKGSVNPNELMVEYLKAKGKTLADFGISVIDHQTVSDGWACVSLVLNASSSLKYSSSGPVGIALTFGFLFNDLGEFLVNFTPAQVAYYELFLKKASVTVPVSLH